MGITPDNENIFCPLCASRGFSLYGETPDFALFRCDRCDLVYKYPRPDTISLKKELNAGYFVNRDESDYLARRRPIFRGLLARVARHRSPPGRLLDVGCARGALIAEAVAQGYRAYGLDLSWGELSAGRRLGVVTSAMGLLEAPPFPECSFDVITLFDFIEHALQPGKAMAAAAELLSPGGVVTLYTGNVASKRARKTGMDWDYIYKDGHLNFFDEKSLRYILTAAGLDIVELQYSALDAGADRALKKVGLPTERLREIFNKQLLPLKNVAKAALGKTVGGEGIFLTALKNK